MKFHLTLTRSDQPEVHSEEVEAPDREFVLVHAARHRFFGEPCERMVVEVVVPQ